jgi:anti-sigma-K factor RskA
MTDYTNDQLLELAAVYAAGGCTPDEAAAVEAAMQTSPEIAAEVAAFREVMTMVGQQGGTAAPSLATRDALLARVSAGKEVTLPTAAALADKRRRGFINAALAASFLIAVVSSVQNVNLEKQVKSLRDASALTEAKLAKRETQLNAVLEGERQIHMVVVSADDTLQGPGMQFFWNERQQRGIAHAFRMKPAPSGHSYQLWLLVDGKPVSVKVFDSDPDGHALVEGLQLPSSVKGATAVLVTVEPKGGSPGPTTKPFMAGSMPKS